LIERLTDDQHVFIRQSVTAVYFPAVPQRENPLVLLQKAVKLMVEDETV
jgi:hypothetical protein